MNEIDNKVKDAIDIFLEHVFAAAYDGAITSVKELLVEGPTGRIKQEDVNNLHNWFQSLGEIDKWMIHNIIERAIRSSVFSFLVMLDNKRGGAPLKGQISDFALYLQTYQDTDSMINYQSREATRINLSNTIGGELHDKFLNLLRDRNDSQE